MEPSAFCVVFIAKWGPSMYRLLARWESTITDAYCFAAFRLLCALLSILLPGIIIRPSVNGTATMLDQSLHSKQIDSLRLEPRATAFSHILCCGHLPLPPELPYTSLYFSPPRPALSPLNILHDHHQTIVSGHIIILAAIVVFYLSYVIVTFCANMWLINLNDYICRVFLYYIKRSLSSNRNAVIQSSSVNENTNVIEKEVAYFIIPKCNNINIISTSCKVAPNFITKSGVHGRLQAGRGSPSRL